MSYSLAHAPVRACLGSSLPRETMDLGTAALALALLGCLVWVLQLRRRVARQQNTLFQAEQTTEALRKELVSASNASIKDLQQSRVAALNIAADSELARIEARASAGRLEAILEAAVDAIMTFTQDGLVESVNTAAGRLFGCSPRKLIGKPVRSLFEIESRGKQSEEGSPALALATSQEGWILRDGVRALPASLSISPVNIAGLSGRVLIARDLSHRQREASRLRLVVEASPTAMVAVDSSGRITLVNAQAERLFLYGREEMLGQHVELLVPEESRETHPGMRARYFEEPSQRAMGSGRDLRARRKDGSTFPVEIGLNPIETDQGLVVLGAVVDLTQRKEVETRLRELAEHDALTGLLNRRGLQTAFTAETMRSRRTGERICVLLIDCDEFKHVNDTFGHTVGDLVLQSIGTTLRNGLRPTDTLARIGGDEFLALLPATRLAEASHVAERLRIAVADRPLSVSGRMVCATASFGVGMAPEDAVTVEELVTAAQDMLIRSKRSGRNRISALDRDSTTSPAATHLEGMARGKGIRVFAQELRSLNDEAVIGHELLTRGPVGEFESPEVFFRIASERSLLTVVDVHCLRRCLIAAAALPGNSPVHVNVFPSTLLELVEARLHELLGVTAGRHGLCLEISEQQFLGDPRYLRDRVQLVRKLGVHIALDDLGFGRSSLESLVLLEPEIVKIDKSLVQGIAQDRGRRRCLERTLAVARSLDAAVIAEGVERAEDATVLAELGIRAAQGYLWQRPTSVLEAS